MKILRFILGAGILYLTFKIGLKINYILAGILLVVGLFLLLTSLRRKKK